MSSTNSGKRKVLCVETEDVVEKDVFKWSINNFKMRLSRGNHKVLTNFVSDKKTESGFALKWRLELSLCPQTSYGIPAQFDDGCYLTIWVDGPVTSTFLSTILITYEVSLVNGIKKKSGRFLDPYKFKLATQQELLDEKNNLLADDTLTILFEVSTVIKSSTTFKKIQFDIPESPLYNELPLLLFKDKESCSDVIIQVDGTDLKAHKFILAAQSPVFSVMLKNKSTNEAQNNRIIIKDMDLEVAKQMLEFIYMNKQPSRINEFANELMAAAQKYEMDRLRVMCEQVLFNNITADDAVKTLIYANMLDVKTLKDAIINFIKNNPSVLKSTEFMQLEKKIPSLFIEVLHKMLLE